MSRNSNQIRATNPANGTFSGPRENDQLLTLTEVADLLRVAPRTIHRYRSAGEFCSPVMLAGRTPRWWRSEVIAWVEAQSTTSPMN